MLTDLTPGIPALPKLVFPPDVTRAAQNQRRLHAVLGTLDAIIREPSTPEERDTAMAVHAQVRTLAEGYEERRRKIELQEMRDKRAKLENELAELQSRLLDAQLRAHLAKGVAKPQETAVVPHVENDGVPKAYPLLQTWRDVHEQYDI